MHMCLWNWIVIEKQTANLKAYKFNTVNFQSQVMTSKFSSLHAVHSLNTRSENLAVDQEKVDQEKDQCASLW